MQSEIMSESKRTDIYSIVICALLLALQLGNGVFVSVQLFLLLLITIYNKKHLQLHWSLIPVCFFLIGYIYALLILPPLHLNFERDARSALGAAILLSLIGSSSKEIKFPIKAGHIYILLMIICVLTILQNFMSSFGHVITPPVDWFSKANDPALAGAGFEHALVNGYDFVARSSLIYSEPSYLGMMTAVFHFVCINSLPKEKKYIASIISLLICAVAETGLGLISNLVIFILYQKNKIPFFIGAVFFSVLYAVFSGGTEYSLFDRFNEILSGKDESTNIRLILPLELIKYTLSNAPVGIPLTGAAQFFENKSLLGQYEDIPLHNGAFNILINYGWLGFAILLPILKRENLALFFVFLTILFQNGSSFEFDKVFLFIFCISAVNNNKKSTAIFKLGNRQNNEFY